MCVIVHKKQNTVFPKNLIRKCFKKNPHGAGVMFRDNNQVIITKGFFEIKNLISFLNAMGDTELIVHFRYATSGQIDKNACHPFELPNGGFVHNGVIRSVYDLRGSDSMSDTQKLQRYLTEHPQKMDTIFQHLADKKDGKFVYLTNENIKFYGEFFDHEGLSFSNLRWLNNKKGSQKKLVQKRSLFITCPSCSTIHRNGKYLCAGCGQILRQYGGK